MAHMESQYGRQIDEYGNPVHQTDAYGNPVRQTDECGNPIHQTGTAATAGTDIRGHEGGAGQLHRSGSTGSSSSEDDGQGGRRKKGLKDKIKEKLPGGHKEDKSYATSTTTPGGYHLAEETHEKKGIMDKIKEKLPGGH